VTGRPRHLHDDRLYECYLTQRQGDSADPPTAEHLADCEDCAARYAELAQLMDAVRAEADAETDAVFTPDRLRAQQQQIVRRMEAVGRPARVISFPGRVVQGTIRASTMRSSRWTAAAAAAGLFLGIALGATYEWEWRAPTSSSGSAALSAPMSLSARGAPVPTRYVVADQAGDEAFMSELESALDRPRTRELAAFDAFTPHFREIRDQR
jgi:anti-sigma factor RsiW